MVVIGVPPTIQAASIGIPDTLFLMLLALVVFGPRRLPEIGRQIGKLMYEFRKVSNDFKYQMEEELRASEEAARQEKLRAETALAPPSPQVTLDVPPGPVAETPMLESGAGETMAVLAESTDATAPVVEPDAESAPAVAGEVRGEPRRFPHIQPPISGEVVAAQKPFRGRTPEAQIDIVTESGSESTHVVETPVMVEDEGRIGTEVQPGVSGEMEREAHHA
jgi:sec-independent protein translocase protein TatB